MSDLAAVSSDGVPRDDLCRGRERSRYHFRAASDRVADFNRHYARQQMLSANAPAQWDAFEQFPSHDPNYRQAHGMPETHGLPGTHGMPRAFDFSMLSSALESIASSLSGLQGGCKQQVAAKYNDVPKSLRNMIHDKVEKRFTKHVDALIHGRELAEKYKILNKSRKMHSSCENTANKRWQITEDQLKLDTSWNPQQVWEELMASHAQAEWELIQKINAKAVELYTSTTQLGYLETQAEKVEEEFWEINGSHLAHVDKRVLHGIICGHLKTMHSEVFTRKMSAFGKRVKAKAEVDKQQAEAQAKLRSMDMQALITGGLLEAAELLRREQLVQSQSGKQKPVQQRKRQISSSTNLGQLLQQYPNVAKDYHCEVVNSLSNNPKIGSRGNGHGKQRKNDHRSRSISGSQSSFRTGRSHSSSARSSQSRASLRSASRAHSSSKSGSRGSRLSSRDKKGGKSKTKGKGKGKRRGRSGSRSDRGSRNSSKDRSVVFRSNNVGQDRRKSNRKIFPKSPHPGNRRNKQ